MKKTAIALAAAIAASSSALAADVTVYGKVDTGLNYTNVSKLGKSTDTFSMASSQNSGSRFGFKGGEELGDGYKVVFQLENQFHSDTGANKNKDSFFHREARLGLVTPYGGLHVGRMGALTSGAGTFDKFVGEGDSFGGGWASYLGTDNWFARDRYNNMVTYESPNLSGFQLYAQYSFGTEEDSGAAMLNNNVYNERNTERYAGFGVSYANGPLTTGLYLDTILRDHKDAHVKDAQAVSFNFAYDFEVAKLFFAAQYGENEKNRFFVSGDFGTVKSSKNQYTAEYEAEGLLLHVGTQVPLPCGTLTAGVWYGNVDNNAYEAENFSVAVGHEYAFSKRTKSYIGVGYKEAKAKDDGKLFAKEKAATAQVGLVHSF